MSKNHAWSLWESDALQAYQQWATPTTIISDGAYGIRGFHGDTTNVETLPEWYLPHIQAWSSAAKPATTLWFWNTEVGWANVHPVLVEHGWEYVQTIVWDKGLGHIAGNVNGQTIRQYPVVTEVCVLYHRKLVGPDDTPLRKWLRSEWTRTGLPLYKANEACGVSNAATRKYLTQDEHWYFPPGKMFVQLATYANKHGKQAGKPYFSFDGTTLLNAEQWDSLRYRWNHQHGLTNVWSEPPLSNSERLKGNLKRSAPRNHSPTKNSATHYNQKPLEFMKRLILSVTQPGDVVWEPFGGLASASVAAVLLNRFPYVAEYNKEFAQIARSRLIEMEQIQP